MSDRGLQFPRRRPAAGAFLLRSGGLWSLITRMMVVKGGRGTNPPTYTHTHTQTPAGLMTRQHNGRNVMMMKKLYLIRQKTHDERLEDLRACRSLIDCWKSFYEDNPASCRPCPLTNCYLEVSIYEPPHDAPSYPVRSDIIYKHAG